MPLDFRMDGELRFFVELPLVGELGSHSSGFAKFGPQGSTTQLEVLADVSLRDGVDGVPVVGVVSIRVSAPGLTPPGLIVAGAAASEDDEADGQDLHPGLLSRD
jgi:hypothetical protein